MHKDYVLHPRYGDKPLYSGLSVSVEKLLDAHWSLAGSTFFPETAIKANIEKQNYSTFPRSYYVDVEKRCAQCNRWFIFFAQEQKFWFEELGFYIDAECTKCVDCRKKEQSIKQLLNLYATLVKTENRSSEQTQQLKHVALELLQLGYIKDSRKIDQIS